MCVRRQLRVTFRLGDGRSCCINEHGATVIDGAAGWLVNEEDFRVAERLEVVSVGSRETVTLTHDELMSFAEHSKGRRKPPTVKEVPLIQSVQ
jgi:hypothetical protein